MLFENEEAKRRYYIEQVKKTAKCLSDLAVYYEKGGSREILVKRMLKKRRTLEEAIFQLYNYGKF